MAENKVETTNPLLQSVKYLKGVGDNRARLLAKLGIKTVLDLLEYFPRAYINRKLNPSLFELNVGDIVAFTAMISWVDIRSSARGKNILNVGVSDSKVGLVCSWFKYPKAYETLFRPGRLVWLSGTLSEYNGQLQMVHPDFELIEEDEDSDFWHQREVLPVYPLTEGLNQKLMRRLIYNAFANYAKLLEENLPASRSEERRVGERV